MHHSERGINLDDPQTSLTKRDVYAFDQFTVNPLDSVNPSIHGSGDIPPLHIFMQDPHYLPPNPHRDWVWLCLTSCKIVEVLVLRKLHAVELSWASALSWCYFLISAVVLQYMQLGRGRVWENVRIDIVSGELPTARRPGGSCRILLNAPANFRHHRLWRLIWFFGIGICVTSIISCYLFLPTSPIYGVYAWGAFQFIWLLCRSVFFHLADGTDRTVYPVFRGERWPNLSHDLKIRVQELLLALAQYETHVNPRGSPAYEGDVMDRRAIRRLLSQHTFLDEYPLDLHLAYEASLLLPTATPRQAEQHVRVGLTFFAIMGNTLLHSACWFHSSKYSAMDLYDCSIAFFELPFNVPLPSGSGGNDETREIAIPIMRARCAVVPTAAPDVESGRPAPDHNQNSNSSLSPRGLPNPGITPLSEWYCWIPCSRDRWIQVESDKMRIVGSVRRGRVMNSDELGAVLKVGNLNIDIDRVEQVQETVMKGREAGLMVQTLLS